MRLIDLFEPQYPVDEAILSPPRDPRPISITTLVGSDRCMPNTSGRCDVEEGLGLDQEVGDYRSHFRGGGHSPLISKKEEVPNSDHDGLEQDQPTHEPPFGLGLGVLHSPKQRRLRQQKTCDHLPRILPTEVSFKHDLLDRVLPIALRQRFQCLLGKSLLKSFFAHNEGSLSETHGSRLPDFDGA